MMNYVKLHMMAVNYKNGGLLDDPEKVKTLTTREVYYAEPLRERVKFWDFWNYFMFCAASYSGPSHEYRKFIDFINL